MKPHYYDKDYYERYFKLRQVVNEGISIILIYVNIL